MSKPNIALVVIDCLRADHVYGPSLAHTLHLGRFRQGGFASRSAIASTSTTTPSFAALLTGLYPVQNGVRSHCG